MKDLLYLLQLIHIKMMETLSTEPGSILEVKNVTLPLGSFVKIQPQSTDFLDISDHRAVLVGLLLLMRWILIRTMT
jgi:hypothetical protein